MRFSCREKTGEVLGKTGIRRGCGKPKYCKEKRGFCARNGGELGRIRKSGNESGKCCGPDRGAELVEVAGRDRCGAGGRIDPEREESGRKNLSESVQNREGRGEVF